MENWESEFLQMGSYVLLAAVLVQRGSPEANPAQVRSDSPAPVRRGGWWLQITSTAFQSCCSGCSCSVSCCTCSAARPRKTWSGTPAASRPCRPASSSVPATSGSSPCIKQSEFLAVGVLIVATIFLGKQRGSAQSKKVTAPPPRGGAARPLRNERADQPGQPEVDQRGHAVVEQHLELVVRHVEQPTEYPDQVARGIVDEVDDLVVRVLPRRTPARYAAPGSARSRL